jgi:hypothetical protein
MGCPSTTSEGSLLPVRREFQWKSGLPLADAQADRVAGTALRKAQLAIEAVRQIEAIFAAEHTIARLPPEERVAARRTRIAPAGIRGRDR